MCHGNCCAVAGTEFGDGSRSIHQSKSRPVPYPGRLFQERALSLCGPATLVSDTIPVGDARAAGFTPAPDEFLALARFHVEVSHQFVDPAILGRAMDVIGLVV